MTTVSPDRRSGSYGRGTRLTVECLTSVEQVERLAPEWQELFQRVDDALPFVSYEWAVAWWTHLRRRSPLVRDELRVFAVRDGGELVAVAPMMLTQRPAVGVSLLRVLQTIGTDPNITELRGMLVSAAREGEVAGALASEVSRLGGYDLVVWCGLRRSADGAERLRAEATAWPSKEISAFTLTMGPSWDEFRKSLPRNIRESLRKCYNSLARDGHEWSFRVLEGEAEVVAAVGRLVDLHGRRAAVTGTVRHRDCFETEEARRFLADVTARLARRGVARMFQLEVAGRVVAMRLGFVWRDRLYLYYSGYDPEWGKYSVMTTTVAEALKYATDSGITSVNLSTGADESKLRWRPSEVQYVDMTARATGARPWLVHRALVGATRGLERARRLRARR